MKKFKKQDYFKEGSNTIGCVGDNFKKHFYGMEFTIPKKLSLKTKILERNMLDKDILSEFKPQESNLGELSYALQNDSILLKNGYANIFYIRDKNKVLWVLNFYWRSDRRVWDVGADPPDYPNRWPAVSQVLSCDFGNFETKKH